MLSKILELFESPILPVPAVSFLIVHRFTVCRRRGAVDDGFVHKLDGADGAVVAVASGFLLLKKDDLVLLAAAVEVRAGDVESELECVCFSFVKKALV